MIKVNKYLDFLLKRSYLKLNIFKQLVKEASLKEVDNLNLKKMRKQLQNKKKLPIKKMKIVLLLQENIH